MTAVSSVLLTSEVARRLGVSAACVRKLVDTGKLPALRTTRGVRLFRKEDIDALAALRRRQTYQDTSVQIGGTVVSQAISPKNELISSVAIPQRFFLKVLRTQSDIARRKMRYDFLKECLPYGTALVMLAIIAFVPKEALIGVAPTLGWMIHRLKRRFDKKDISLD